MVYRRRLTSVLLESGTVSPTDTVTTWVDPDTGLMHLVQYCAQRNADSVETTTTWTVLDTVPDMRRCSCFGPLHHYSDAVPGDMSLVHALAGQDPTDVPPLRAVGLLRGQAHHLAWLQRDRAFARYAPHANERALEVLTEATTITSTPGYAIDAAAAILSGLETHERLSTVDKLTDVPARHRARLRDGLHLLRDLTGRSPAGYLHDASADHASMVETLVPLWRQLTGHTMWFTANAVGVTEPTGPITLAVDTDPWDEPQLLRLPTVVWWTSHGSWLRPATADGTLPRRQVAEAVRLCGPNLDRVDDTLAALAVAAT